MNIQIPPCNLSLVLLADLSDRDIEIFAAFGISAVVALIIALILKKIFEKRYYVEMNSNAFFGCFVLAFVVVSCIAVSATSESDNKDSVSVYFVSERKFKNVPKTEFVGSNAQLCEYSRFHEVYYNDTGRDLVEYSVKYIKTNGIVGTGTDLPTGHIIKPNTYFWIVGLREENMFCKPPDATTITYRKNARVSDYTYLKFLDYADNVRGEVKF